MTKEAQGKIKAVVALFIIPREQEMEKVKTKIKNKRIVINSHWEPSLTNAPGKDKLWEKASPEEKRSGS